MPCNFFKNHSSFFSSFDFFLEFIIFWFFSIIGGSLFFGVIRDFIDAPTIIFLIYLMLYPQLN